MNAQAIYIAMMTEVAQRLTSAQYFIERHADNAGLAYLESATLQLRKAMEAIAFAAIAPNQEAYQAIRVQAEENKDFTRDFHAGRIFRDLQRVQEDFYPLALVPAVNLTPEKQTNRTWHYDRKQNGYLSKERFTSVYDKLGKHLHAHNPWSHSASLEGLNGLLSTVIAEAQSLIELHAAFIRTAEFTGVWIVEIPKGTASPKIITGQTEGDFTVSNGEKS